MPGPATLHLCLVCSIIEPECYHQWLQEYLGTIIACCAVLPMDIQVVEIPHQDKSLQAWCILYLRPEGLVNRLPWIWWPVVDLDNQVSFIFTNKLSTCLWLFLRGSSLPSVKHQGQLTCLSLLKACSLQLQYFSFEIDLTTSLWQQLGHSCLIALQFPTPCACFPCMCIGVVAL